MNKQYFKTIFLSLTSFSLISCSVSFSKNISFSESSEDSYEEIIESSEEIVSNENVSSIEEDLSIETSEIVSETAEETIAESSVSNLTKREIAVNYMFEMSQLSWTPSEDIQYYSKESSKVFKAGKTYKGLPYTMEAGRTSALEDPLEMFKDNLIDSVYYGPSKYNTYLGSDCSSSVDASWRKAGVTTGAIYTGAMIPGENKKISSVGSYDYSDRSNMSKSICISNGKQKMFSCYELLLPGDALVKRVNDGSGYSGHVRLVKSVDAENKKVTVIEQCGYGIDNQTITTWRVNREYTFDSLFTYYYIPITPVGL